MSVWRSGCGDEGCRGEGVLRKDQCPEPEATPPHLSWKHSHVTFAPPLVQLISDAFMLLAYMWTPLSDPTTGKESWESSQEGGGGGGGEGRREGGVS